MAAKKKRPPSPQARRRAQEILKRLSAEIPHPHVELHFESPWHLLVAVILSAQSTDKTVNSTVSSSTNSAGMSLFFMLVSSAGQ